MKIIYFLTILILFFTVNVDGIEYIPFNEKSLGAICVERPENIGVLNIKPATILFNNGQSVTLIGRQASCIFVAPGKYTVKAESNDPYEISMLEPWISNKIELEVGASEVIILVLTRDKNQKGGWNLKIKK